MTIKIDKRVREFKINEATLGDEEKLQNFKEGTFYSENHSVFVLNVLYLFHRATSFPQKILLPREEYFSEMQNVMQFLFESFARTLFGDVSLEDFY